MFEEFYVHNITFKTFFVFLKVFKDFHNFSHHKWVYIILYLFLCIIYFYFMSWPQTLKIIQPFFI